MVDAGLRDQLDKGLAAAIENRDFEVVDFPEIGGNGRSVPQIESAKGGIGKPVKQAAVEEELNDEIPWR